jgi:hypothetical protein
VCRRNLAGASGETDGSCFDSCRYIAHTELYGNNSEQAYKIKCRGRLQYCLEEQVDENHLHPTVWCQELKVTGFSKGDIEARYNLR